MKTLKFKMTDSSYYIKPSAELLRGLPYILRNEGNGLGVRWLEFNANANANHLYRATWDICLIEGVEYYHVTVPEKHNFGYCFLLQSVKERYESLKIQNGEGRETPA